MGRPGPLWAGPLWAPWALMGLALIGPPWALMGLPGPLWAEPLRASLGPYGPGPYGPPWALMGWALMGRALMGPWVQFLSLFPRLAGPNQLMSHPHIYNSVIQFHNLIP